MNTGVIRQTLRDSNSINSLLPVYWKYRIQRIKSTRKVGTEIRQACIYARIERCTAYNDLCWRIYDTPSNIKDYATRRYEQVRRYKRQEMSGRKE